VNSDPKVGMIIFTLEQVNAIWFEVYDRCKQKDDGEKVYLSLKNERFTKNDQNKAMPN
jgi:hypothetical protein